MFMVLWKALYFIPLELFIFNVLFLFAHLTYHEFCLSLSCSMPYTVPMSSIASNDFFPSIQFFS